MLASKQQLSIRRLPLFYTGIPQIKYLGTCTQSFNLNIITYLIYSNQHYYNKVLVKCYIESKLTLDELQHNLDLAAE